MTPSLSRRQFLESGTAALTTGLLLQDAAAADKEPIIDIHQHTHYHGRTDEKMLSHQRAMGVTTTILLPSGTPVKRPSTHPLTGSLTTRPAVLPASADGSRTIKGAPTVAWYGATLDLNPCCPQPNP